MATDSKNSLSNSELSSFFDNDIYIIEKKKNPGNTLSNDITSPISGLNAIVVIIKDEKEKASYGELLKKILQAVNIDIKNISLLKSDDIQSLTSDNLSDAKFKTLISFGVNSKTLKLDLNEKMNEIKDVNNTRYLFTNTLEEIENDVVKKKSLWTSLQTLFK